MENDTFTEMVKSVSSNFIAQLIFLLVTGYLLKPFAEHWTPALRGGMSRAARAFYYVRGATSLWLVRIALIWYGSLLGATSYEYLAYRYAPVWVYILLLIGLCVLLAHAVWTWIRWGREQAQVGG